MANPVVGNQTRFPQRSTKMDDEEEGGGIALPWYLFLNSLFNRTGAGTGIWTLTPANLTNAGALQATAPELPANLNFVTASGLGVALPPATPGNILVVVNVTVSQALNVYPSAKPPGGAQINSLGANAPYVMNPGGAIAKPTFQLFFFASLTQIYAGALG